MQLHSWTLSTLAALAVAFLPAAEVPHFAPAEGSQVTRKIKVANHLVSDSIKVELDGEEQETGEAKFTSDDSNEIVVMDEFVKVGGGHPLELHRTYQVLTGKSSRESKGEEGDDEEGGAQKREQASELSDKTVVFKWNDKEDKYDRTFAEEKGDEALLEHLDEDMDLRAFLPKSGVKEDDNWTIEGSQAAAFLFPGGDLKLEDTEKDESDEGNQDELDQHLRENLKGSLEVTYKGTREEGGKKVGILALKGKVESTGDMTTADESKITVTIGGDLTGEILWDIAANRVHSATAELEQKVAYKAERSMDFGGSSHSFKEDIELVGKMNFEMAVTK